MSQRLTVSASEPARTSFEQALAFNTGNGAGAYGPNLATGPANITTQQSALPHVPGQSTLDVKLALFDALGQAVYSSSEHDVPYVIKVVICSSDVACSSLEECSKSALQPPIVFSLGLTKETSAMMQMRTQLAYCPSSKTQVNVHLFFSDLVPPHSFPIACGPCEKNQKMRTMTLPKALYACESCEEDEYIVDPTNPKHRCQKRARGMIDAVPGSKWSLSGDVFRLSECPAGYLLSRREDSPTDDRCVPCGEDTYSLDIKTNSTAAFQLQACIECPTGGNSSSSCVVVVAEF